MPRIAVSQACMDALAARSLQDGAIAFRNAGSWRLPGGRWSIRVDAALLVRLRELDPNPEAAIWYLLKEVP
jgi:hypothetical protein